ncbi:MAG: L-histidine N(alpha)-methyltransferase [Bacteroidales bacterium]|nr:L-histidine N(alpha)-methyltransferase [Bacteroidales bacterium]
MSPKTILSSIAADAVKGLYSDPKYLLSKYFYDDEGSAIFRDIMKMPEYYLTDCEMEIFEEQKEHITEAFMQGGRSFDLIELGSGDGLKTRVLLRSLLDSKASLRYIPVDISGEANDMLVKSLARELPSLEVKALTGDFFRLSSQISGSSERPKVILFLGSNIGNFTDSEIRDFLDMLATALNRGDRVMIGYDLKKSPRIIMDAYNDSQGHTRRFNLNHLLRLNRELDADFNTGNFEHHSTYNPVSGEVKSYLVSSSDQVVKFGSTGDIFRFRKWESIFMERSRKFGIDDIESLAADHGFRVLKHFTDSRDWFADSLWEKTG